MQDWFDKFEFLQYEVRLYVRGHPPLTHPSSCSATHPTLPLRSTATASTKSASLRMWTWTCSTHHCPVGWSPPPPYRRSPRQLQTIHTIVSCHLTQLKSVLCTCTLAVDDCHCWHCMGLSHPRFTWLPRLPCAALPYALHQQWVQGIPPHAATEVGKEVQNMILLLPLCVTGRGGLVVCGAVQCLLLQPIYTICITV